MRRNYAAAFKAKVAVAALKGDKTLAEIADQFDVHVNQVAQWRSQLLERASGVFATAGERREPAGPEIKELRRCHKHSFFGRKESSLRLDDGSRMS
jgi:transposase